MEGRTINFMVWGVYNLFDKGLLGSLLGKNTFSETQTAWLIGGAFAFCIIFSYLVGSVNCALVISRLFYHDDVRRHGSGNAGATNVMRNYGRKAGILTFAGDGLKGALCIVVACLIFGCPPSERYYIYLVAAAYMSAFFCVFGHVFPCFAKFHGGKGFATMAVSVICLNPFIAAVLAVVFFPLVGMTKYVSLGSVVIAMFYPILLSTFDSMKNSTHYGISTLFAFLIGALVTWAHRGNIKRIMNRTERKLGEHKTSAEAGEKLPQTNEDESVPAATPDRDNDAEISAPLLARSGVKIKQKKHPVSKKKLKRQKKGKL